MRNATLFVASLCLLTSALIAPLAAQGGKKKHAADSTPPVTSDQTIKTAQTVNVNFTTKSDLTFKSDMTVSSGETPAEETTSNLHMPAFSSLPIALKWEFKDEFGYAELILFDNGVWQLVGKYDNKEPDRYFEAVIALKDKSGNVFIFHHVYRAFKGRTNWGGQGASPTLATWLADLSKGFEVRGAYRFPTRAEGNAQATADKSTACQTNAQFAAGWRSIWTWVDPHRQCFQFNSDI